MSNKLHQLNLKQEHLSGELDKIKELSDTIIAFLVHLQNRDEDETSNGNDSKRGVVGDEISDKDRD